MNAKTRPASRPPQRRLRSTVSRAVKSPMYVQVYSALREWILEGFYAAGSQLPTEGALSELFGVSRITIRQAIDLLSTEKLVQRQQGRGTFIASDLASAPVRGDMDQLMRKVKRLGSNSSIRDARITEVRADGDTCRDLALEPGSRVTKAAHVRLMDGVPIGYVVTWLPLDLELKLDPQELSRDAMLTLLERKGISIAGAEQFIGATLANTSLAGLLDIEVGAPLVTVRLVVFDQAHRPVERLLAYYRADHYTHHSYLARGRG